MEDHERKRVIAFLTREEMEFLDKISMDALFTTGFKFSRIDLISAVVTAVMQSKATGEGVKSKEELIQRILDGIYREIDRRKFPRLKASLDIHFAGLESMEKQKKHEVTDLSLGGLRVACGEKDDLPEINQMIEISIADPNSQKGAVKTIGKVIWIEKGSRDGVFDIGVALTYINKSDKATLEEFLSAKTVA